MSKETDVVKLSQIEAADLCMFEFARPPANSVKSCKLMYVGEMKKPCMTEVYVFSPERT